jgi:hypothetical protein
VARVTELATISADEEDPVEKVCSSENDRTVMPRRLFRELFSYYDISTFMGAGTD